MANALCQHADVSFDVGITARTERAQHCIQNLQATRKRGLHEDGSVSTWHACRQAPLHLSSKHAVTGCLVSLLPPHRYCAVWVSCAHLDRRSLNRQKCFLLFACDLDGRKVAAQPHHSGQVCDEVILKFRRWRPWGRFIIIRAVTSRCAS